MCSEIQSNKNLPFIHDWIIISKCSLSMDFHTFGYLQTSVWKLLPQPEYHNRGKLAHTAPFPDTILFLIQCRGKLLRSFILSLQTVFTCCAYGNIFPSSFISVNCSLLSKCPVISFTNLSTFTIISCLSADITALILKQKLKPHYNDPHICAGLWYH